MTTDTATAETPRIYVASLTDYNDGRLHGVWIDLAENDLDETWGKIRAMLASSPTARLFPEGGPAEEWAIHDHEGFGPLRISEYASIDRLVGIAEAVEEHYEQRDALLVWLAHDDANDVNEFEDAYAGSYDSERDAHIEFATEFVLDQFSTMLSNLPAYVDGADALSRMWNENIADYVDEEAIGRSIADCSYYLLPSGGEVHAFRMDP